MRPPTATDHVPQPRLRVRYIQKVAPYNAGEDRTVDASVARKLCILGVAIPSPKMNEKDAFGGWSLSPVEVRSAQQVSADQQRNAGDYAEDLAAEAAARKDEEARVVAESEKKNGKPVTEAKKGGFLRGRKPEVADEAAAAK